MPELTLHILDLIQNSIEAGATYVKLEIIEDTATDTLIIRVSDNGRGMDEKLRQSVTDPFTTTRTTRHIGLGLPLMDMSTKGCDGYLKIMSTPSVGTTIEAMYRHSHLDRPPMGNLVQTIKTVLVGNEGFNFSYCHTVNKNEFSNQFSNQFSLSSAEISESLGGIEFTHPEVLNWLQEYLTKNITSLYSKSG